jgi:hypothetical protein
MITVKTGVVSGICRLSVLDIMGQEVLAADIAGPASQIDISRLPGGIYILKLTNGGSLSYAKFIKR